MNPSMQLLEAARAEREAVGENEDESMSLRELLDTVRIAVLRKVAGPVAVALPGDSTNA